MAEQVRKDGHTLEVVQADVTSPDGRRAMVDAAVKHFGGLDVLDQQRRHRGHRPLRRHDDPDVLRKIFETNFFGTTETTRLFLPLLEARDQAGHREHLVGRRPAGAAGPVALLVEQVRGRGLSEAIRGELAKDGIDVLVVNPGLTQTNFSKNMLEQKARMQMDHMRGMTSEEVAEATLRSVEKGRNNTSLTRRGKMLLFVNRFCPWVIDFFAKKKVRKLFAEEIAARKAELPKA